MQKRYHQGFTLIEVLISMVILTALVAITAPVGLNFYLDYQLDSEAELLGGLIRQARDLAMVNFNQSAHGLYVDSDEMVIFEGASYLTRNQEQDESFPRNSAITVSGPSEVVFSALSGQTASSTYTLSDPRSRTRDIFINPEGLVYE